MNAKNKVIFYALILGIILYFIDTLIYFLVFNEDSSFMQVLITAVPLTEMYNRILMFGGVLIFGFIVSGIISDLKFDNELLAHQSTSGSGKSDTGFISGLSYQIRTPLNAIVGFSELLKDPNLSAQSKQTYINHIHSSGNYLLQFINNIVDISKIESNQLTINPVECRLNNIMDDVFKQFDDQKKELGKPEISLVLKKGNNDNNFSIIADKDRLKQVLSNLLENALKNSDEGVVEFGYTIKENNILEVYVKDSGKGYSAERLEVIFNRYKKLSDNQNQPFDTSALRLTISLNIAKLMGGEIKADSKLGLGSIFYFVVPFKAVEPGKEKSVQMKISKPKDKDWSQKTLLIAEDVESNYIYLQELLKPTHIKLLWAQNGNEAVNHVKNDDQINLVLMDILMPEMDGYEASKVIKTMRSELPIVAQTAYSLDSDRDKEELRNFSDYLIKPIWSPQLMSTLEKYLK